MFGVRFRTFLEKAKNWFVKRSCPSVKQGRPHFYSKAAWAYVRRGQLTPAMRLLLNLGAFR